MDSPIKTEQPQPVLKIHPEESPMDKRWEQLEVVWPKRLKLKVQNPV